SMPAASPSKVKTKVSSTFSMVMPSPVIESIGEPVASMRQPMPSSSSMSVTVNSTSSGASVISDSRSAQLRSSRVAIPVRSAISMATSRVSSSLIVRAMSRRKHPASTSSSGRRSSAVRPRRARDGPVMLACVLMPGTLSPAGGGPRARDGPGRGEFSPPGSGPWTLPTAHPDQSVGLRDVKILVVGSGAREHAIARALTSDSTAHEVLVAPGNPGTAQIATNLSVDPLDPEAVAALAVEHGAELVVVGPEAPLVAGVADAVRAAGIPCFGPSAEAARLEGSKAFAKEVMASANVPTAMAYVCTTLDEVARALDAFGAPYVV